MIGKCKEKQVPENSSQNDEVSSMRSTSLEVLEYQLLCQRREQEQKLQEEIELMLGNELRYYSDGSGFYQ